MIYVIKQEGLYQNKVNSSLRGDSGARGRKQGKERLQAQGDHCFLHFSHSNSEHENSDWSD